MSSPLSKTLCAVTLLFVASCSSSHRRNPCGDVDDPCDAPEDTRCSRDSDAVEVCRPDPAGCLSWTLGATCDGPGSCLFEDDMASCANATCDGVVSPCDDPGATRCDAEGDSVETCMLDDDGCFAWSPTAICGGTGSCAIVDGEAVCDESCAAECDAEGLERCSASREAVEICEASEGGCLLWVVDRYCADGPCQEVGGRADCLPECIDECVEGDLRCRDGWIEGCDFSTGCGHWARFEDCGASGTYCVEEGGDTYCRDECVDNCPAEGVTACDGEVVEVCVGTESGCLQWADQRDCGAAGMTCAEGAAGATCVCPPGCAPGETRCDGDSVQECLTIEGGCTEWVDRLDCGALGQSCRVTDAGAICVDEGGGCGDATVLSDFPAVIGGASFSADFDDAQRFTHDTCEQRDGSPEAIFVVDVAAGERIWMMEWDDVNIVMSVQSACDPAGPCELSIDDFSWSGLVFDPPSPGRYWIIVETSGPETAGAAYEIEIDLITDEDCGDGLDNDRDGEIDCGDDECFGDPISCATETECADGDDNDRDRLVDCDDPDCDASPDCGPALGIWESWEADEWMDLSGSTLTFVPDASAPMGYAWSAAGGLTGYPVTPGTGTTTILSLSDDDWEDVGLGAMGVFEFYGETYDRILVSSNGLVTFVDGVADFTPELAELFGQPTIALLWSDLNPGGPGAPAAVTVDAFPDRVAITWDGIKRYGTADPMELQLVLHADGTIDMCYVALAPPAGERLTLVGVSSGVGLPPYPDETDFVTLAPESDCGDGLDNDGDGAVDCDDPDCAGAAGCVETRCDDGLDDDGDGLIDCDDPDCFGDPTWCATELNCEDGLDNDGDGAVDCDDPDCDDPWVCEPFHGVWESFGRGEAVDVERHTVTFTPDASAPEGYTWAVTPVIAVGFPVPPGSGDTSTPLTLTDDDFQEFGLAHMSGFPFYGVDYTEIFVGSNGYVTFGEGSPQPRSGVEYHFELPSVAGLRSDLDPSRGGTITVDELPDRVAITWQGVPPFGARDPVAVPNDVQIVLHDDGRIDVTILLENVTPCLVGISNGVGNGAFPPETNYVP